MAIYTFNAESYSVGTNVESLGILTKSGNFQPGSFTIADFSGKKGAKLSTNVGSSLVYYEPAGVLQDCEVIVSIKLNGEFSLNLRRAGTEFISCPNFRISDGRFLVNQRISGTTTTLTQSTGIITANNYFVKTRLVGTDLKIKYWIDGNSEPGAWNYETSSIGVTSTSKLTFDKYDESTEGMVIYSIEVRTGADISGNAEPSISLAGVYAPGQTITATLSNFVGVPTQATLTDSNSNARVVSLTSVGGNDYTFPLPSLPSDGNNSAGLLFGDVTVEITDPGA